MGIKILIIDFFVIVGYIYKAACTLFFCILYFFVYFLRGISKVLLSKWLNKKLVWSLLIAQEYVFRSIQTQLKDCFLVVNLFLFTWNNKKLMYIMTFAIYICIFSHVPGEMNLL